MLMHFLSTRTILPFLPSHLSVWSQSVYKKLCKTGKGNITDSCVANTDLVSTCSSTTAQPTLDFQAITKSVTACSLQGATSTTHPAPDGLSVIKITFAQQDLSSDISNILMASWRTETKQYKTYVERWLVFCRERTIHHSSPKRGEALQFLMSLYNQGLTYSTINTARSALPLILDIEGPHLFGSHPLLSWFLKGIYETPKPQPKYKAIWDVAVVLKHLKTLEPLEELHLKDLTLKLLLLLLLVTGQSGQTIYLLNLDGMTMSSQTCHFELLEHMKTSKPSKKRNSIIIHSFREKNTLCPLLMLKEYLERTVPLRGTELHTTT